MATRTPNLSLIKPGPDDAVDVADLNENFDKIDNFAGGVGGDTYTKSEIDEMLAEKVNTEEGKGLSSNDFTDTDKAQIAANKAGIGAVANAGSKNIVNIQKPTTVTRTSYTALTNGGVELSCTNAQWTAYAIADIGVESGKTYVIKFLLDESSGTNDFYFFLRENNSSGSNLATKNYGSATGEYVAEFTPTNDIAWLGIYLNNSATARTATAKVRCAIMPKVLYDADPTYVPYAPTNRELFENKVDKAEVATIANRGSKNLLPINSHAVGDITETNGFRFTAQADGGILIEDIGTHSGNADYYLIGQWGNRDTLIDCSDDTYTATLEANDDTVSKVSMRIYKTGNSPIINNLYANTSANFAGEITFIFITAYTDAVIPSGGVVVYPMIRPASIEDSTYVPYAPTNRELYEMILSLQSGT